MTTAARSQALPNVPTVGEFVPGYEASFVYGLGAPKNTPIPRCECLTGVRKMGKRILIRSLTPIAFL